MNKTAKNFFHAFAYLYTSLLFIFVWGVFILRIGFSQYIELKAGVLNFIFYSIFLVIHMLILLLVDDLILRIVSLIMLIPLVIVSQWVLSPYYFSQTNIFIIVSIILLGYLLTFVFLRNSNEKKHMVYKKCVRGAASVLLSFLLVYLFFIQFIIPHDFEKVVVKQKQISPNEKYVAKVCQFEGGSHNLEQVVDVYSNQFNDLLLFCMIPPKIDRVHIRSELQIEIKWQDDQTLIINDEIYPIS